MGQVSPALLGMQGYGQLAFKQPAISATNPFATNLLSPDKQAQEQQNWFTKPKDSESGLQGMIASLLLSMQLMMAQLAQMMSRLLSPVTSLFNDVNRVDSQIGPTGFFPSIGHHRSHYGGGAASSQTSGPAAGSVASSGAGQGLSNAVPDKIRQYEPQIMASAKKYGVDPALIAGVIQQESGGNTNAGSGAGACGLMQLLPSTAGCSAQELKSNPALNIDKGTQYLKQQLDRYHGNVDKALAAYNAGPGAVDKYGGVPPYAETQHYVQAVKGNYEKYKGSFNGGQTDGASGSRIVDMARQHIGQNRVEAGMPAEHWCADFASSIVKQAGVHGLGSPSCDTLVSQAQSSGRFMDRSQVSQVKPGDLAVFKDGPGDWGHVAIVEKVDSNGTIHTIGGNQGGHGGGSSFFNSSHVTRSTAQGDGRDFAFIRTH